MDEVNIRSEEVQEILGTPPGWMIRYGTIVAITFFVVLIVLAAIISYPDSQEADITITFTDPPRTLVAPKSGTVGEIFVRNSQTVEKDQVLLVFNDKADFNHVLFLQDQIEKIEDDNDSMILAFVPPTDLQLGELQEDFLGFTEKKNQYDRQTTQFTSDENVGSYRNQIASLRKSIGYLRQRKSVIAGQIDDAIKEKNILNQKVADGEASQEDVNKITSEIRNYRSDMQKTEEDIRRNNFDIEVLQNRINNARQGDNQVRLEASDDLKSSFIRLKIRVNQWVSTNMVVSPIAGMVEIDEAVSEQQFLESSQPVMRVIPMESRQLLGRMSLGFQNSGLVEVGQRVIIKLKRYPFEEYGAIRGLVSFKARVPDEDKMVQIQVVFPDDLVTTTGQVIKPDEALFGEGKIITDDKVLLDRVFNYGRSLFSSL